MPTIEIIRKDLSISQLRATAARTADAKQTRRILAIAMVLDGHSQAGGMDRQTLRDWVWQGFAADWSSDQRAFKNVPWGSWLISGRGLVTPLLACGPAGGSVAKGMKKISYRGYRFPPEIIQQAIWLYLRFTLPT